MNGTMGGCDGSSCDGDGGNGGGESLGIHWLIKTKELAMSL